MVGRRIFGTKVKQKYPTPCHGHHGGVAGIMYPSTTTTTATRLGWLANQDGKASSPPPPLSLRCGVPHETAVWRELPCSQAFPFQSCNCSSATCTRTPLAQRRNLHCVSSFCLLLLSLVLCFHSNTNIKTLLIWRGRNKSREREWRFATRTKSRVPVRVLRRVRWAPTRKDRPRNPIIGRSHVTCVSEDADVSAAEPVGRRSRPPECTSGPIDHLLSAMMASPVDICAPPVGPPV